MLNMFLNTPLHFLSTPKFVAFLGMLKVGLSPSKKVCFIRLIKSPLKVMKNVFYFIVRAPFVLNIWIFVLTFWVMWKNGLIRKLKLISKFMTSQPGWQVIGIHILANILRNKDSQTMKFGDLIEYNKRNIFFKSYAENKTWELVPNLFLFFKNAL